MRRSAWTLIAALALSSCDETQQPSKPAQTEQEEQQTMGGSSMADKGSGEVAIGQSEADKATIAERYQKALGLIQKRDWDGARSELLEAYQRSPDAATRKEIQGHLKLVEQGLLEQPAYPVPAIFGAAEKLFDKSVSVRGRFIPGGAIGKVNYYFWVESGRKIQVRYGQLLLEDKKVIHTLTEGSQVLVRGALKSPWGSNPNPYLEAQFFRLEKRAAAKAPAGGS